MNFSEIIFKYLQIRYLEKLDNKPVKPNILIYCSTEHELMKIFRVNLLRDIYI